MIGKGNRMNVFEEPGYGFLYGLQPFKVGRYLCVSKTAILLVPHKLTCSGDCDCIYLIYYTIFDKMHFDGHIPPPFSFLVYYIFNASYFVIIILNGGHTGLGVCFFTQGP
jgi:hypothetical protein